MNEKLLQYIWQYQYYNKGSLQTERQEAITIHFQGSINFNQGPDFLNATISIDNIKLSGNVELHVKSSDWNKHKHNTDKQYNNIILHVVWINDTIIYDIYNQPIPTLVLQNRVPKLLLDKYALLTESPTIACQNNGLEKLSTIGWMAWKERLLAERLERKSAAILILLSETNNHWEATFWITLAANFGGTINGELFTAVAKSIDITILAKHKNQLVQLEALLLGQANLLNIETTNPYTLQLQKEYQFLKAKYKLQPTTILPKFLRMRPANFPTIRLAQLAALIHQSLHLFSIIKATNTAKELAALFKVIPSNYWLKHYQLTNEESNISKPKNIGKSTIDNLIINTISPIVFAYGLHLKEEKFKEKAIQWLQEVKPESNNIITQWQQLGKTVTNSFETQAIIELYKNYCLQRKCLQCAVGNAIFKQAI